MPQTTSPIEFAFQLGLQRIQLQTEFFDALDQKTGMILGFVVVSIAELLGFLLLAAAEGLKASRYFTVPVMAFFFLGLIFVCLCTFFGFRSLWMRHFALGFNLAAIIQEANPARGLTVDQVCENSLSDVLKSVADNVELLETKQRYVRATTITFLLAMLCYAFAAALIFVYLRVGV